MQLWTPEHTKTVLPAFAVMLIIGLLLNRLLGKKELRVRMIPFQLLTCLLLVLELGKQILSLCRGYDLYHLPFHFCSLFIFAMPAMAFYRGKYRPQVNAVTSALCMAVLFMMLVYPNLIYPGGSVDAFFTDYFSFHTVFYHNLVMLAVVLIFALQLYTPEKGQGKYVVLFMAGFCLVSAVMAQLLKTNFANFYQCNIPVLETVRQAVQAALGTVAAQIVYVILVSAVHILGTWMAYGLNVATFRLIKRSKNQQKMKISK